ncbi:MAG: FtsX-like permease family protein, partial [Acidobacteria bacterium]|nr:FtsX-like permease family protein [Acidobacteriota bacterium]
ADMPSGNLLQVSPGFFRTAGIPLLAGRDFSAEDHGEAPLVVVVNDALRRRYWPGEEAVGRSILAQGSRLEVVGVVGDVRQVGLEREAPPTLYMAQAQVPRRGMSFVLRTRGNPLDLVRSAQAAVWRADPDQPIDEISSLEQLLADSTARPRLLALLLSAFAALAMLLAAVGIYGVLAHSVRRRGHEIGVRVALGAKRSEVLRMVVGQGMVPIVAGMALGLGLAVALSRFLEGVVFGVAAVDLPTYLVVLVFFSAVGLLACYVPGRAALRVDPVAALRED